MAAALRAAGNEALQRGDVVMALNLYSQALGSAGLSDGERSLLHANRSAAFLRLPAHVQLPGGTSRFVAAERDGIAASHFDQSNAKAYARIGAARTALGNHDGAAAALAAGVRACGRMPALLDALRAAVAAAKKAASDNHAQWAAWFERLLQAAPLQVDDGGGGGAVTVEALAAGEARARAMLMASWRRRGYAVVRLGGDPAVARAVLEAQRDARHFFDRASIAEKGYMCPNEYEVFDARVRNTHPSFRWPSQPQRFEASSTTLFNCLHAIAIDALRAVCDALHVPHETLLEAVGSEATALRLLRYRPDRPGHRYPVHTDSGLVTVAPRATHAGLEAKVLRHQAKAADDDGEWVNVEEGLQALDCIVFAGDTLDRMTGHFVPALMHRAVSAAADATASRISTPFFLRARMQAPCDVGVLRSPVLQAADPMPACVAATVTVEALDDNVDLCRDRMPWRHGPYYADMTYSEGNSAAEVERLVSDD